METRATSDELRQRWRAWCRRFRAQVARAEAEDRDLGGFEPLPEELRGLTCGARTRAGTPCTRVDLMKSGRCKLHGGLSTGPKTQVAAQRANLAKRWKTESP